MNRFLRSTFFLFTIAFSLGVHSDTKRPAAAEMTDINLNQSWQEIYKAITNHLGPLDKLCKLQVHMRYLLSHAALATNHSNTAVTGFYCTQPLTQFEDWLKWSEKQYLSNPTNPTTVYLYADALARAEKPNEAIGKFNTALELAPEDAMVLNARGTAYLVLYMETAQVSHLLLAYKDWKRAIKISNGKLLDAQVNMAVASLSSSGGIDKAKRDFQKVLDAEPEHWMAQLGKAVSYGAEGDYKRYGDSMKKLLEQSRNSQFLAALLSENNLKANIEGAGARGFQLLKKRLGKLLIRLALEIIKRGGVFHYLKENENLVVQDGVNQEIGTWVTLNYPTKKYVVDDTKELPTP